MPAATDMPAPTMTITDTVAHAHNFDQINDQLWATCAHEKHTFMFSAELCDALQVCYERMHEHWRGKPKPNWRWAPWRTLASDELIAKKEDTIPEHNNYDGRNYITE